MKLWAQYVTAFGLFFIGGYAADQGWQLTTFFTWVASLITLVNAMEQDSNS